MLHAALEGEWVHGLFMNNYGQGPMDDVFVLNLGLRAARQDGDRDTRIEPYLNLGNLLDARYAYVEGYTMPGFNVLSGLRLTL